jgi:hypothetical protein
MRLSHGENVTQVHLAVGVSAIVLNGLAALYGAWEWWRFRSSVWFWRLARLGQAVIVLQVALGGVLVLLGHNPPGLHVLYGLLPLVISMLAEVLRAASAQVVLDARGFESAQAVGRLADADQRAVVMAILRREVGVMALAALVNLVLLLRAAQTHG